MKPLSHRGAVALMLAATLLWSIAGVVSRHLESARSFEITFWRSAFNAFALVLLLSWMRGPRELWRSLFDSARAVWLSGLCWAVMFTNFMLALTLTTVANVLVTMALAPLFTALVSRMALQHRLPARTWGAIVTAGVGIAWMYASEIRGGDSTHLLGTLVALGVPIAAAANWTVMQHAARHEPTGARRSDMLAAVLVGATLSAAFTLPLAWPLNAPPHDIGLLGMLGVVQLAVPCVLAVTATRVLAAPEVALLGLLEVIFGVAWAWLGAGERPNAPVLGGGLLVLGALAANELPAMRRRPALP